jgi:hypothetical protein
MIVTKRLFHFLFFIFVQTTHIAWCQKSFIVQIGTSDNINTIARSRSATGLKFTSIFTSPFNTIVVESQNETSVEELRNKLKNDFNIISIQPNRKIKTRNIPNDSLYYKQWQYGNTGMNSNGGIPGADIGGSKAWDITTGSKTIDGREIIIAVIDDGVTLSHPDLINNLWKNKEEIPNNGIDDDKNGYIDDYHGWNVISKNDKVDNDASHGSPVAGIIGAQGNNKIGVAGVSWDTKIMPIYYGNASEANALTSYAYAYTMRKLYNESNGKKGAFIVATNSSWGIDGGKAEEAPLWCAMYDSLGKVGILNIAATANNNVDVDREGDLPTTCNSEFLMSVTNLNKFNQRANAGIGYKSIDIAAYGDGVYTLDKNNYNTFNGTSAAAPHVAGAVALVYASPCNLIKNLLLLAPHETALAVKDLILSNTKKNDIYKGITTSEGVLHLDTLILKLFQTSECTPPISLKNEISNFKNLKISWLPSNSTKQIRYAKVGLDQTWTNTPFFQSDEYSLNTIDFCTEYAYQIRYICGSDTSKWSYARHVTTEGCCNAPSKVSYTLSDKAISVLGDPNKEYLIALSNNVNSRKDTIQFKEKINLTNLEECAQYSMSIAEYCLIQNQYSIWSVPISNSSYCGECSKNYCPPGIYENDAEWIDEVEINGKIIKTGKSSRGFAEHIGAFVPKVRKGDSISVIIRPGYKGSSFREYYAGYADWNANGSFETSELIYQSTEPISGQCSFVFSIPENATFGLTRLRLIMSYTGKQKGCQGDAEFGETEDYCINILNPSNTADVSNQSIEIKPNPNAGEFTISSEKDINNIKIYDYTGKEVYQSNIKISTETNISLNLDTGIYLLEAVIDGKKSLSKIVIHH